MSHFTVLVIGPDHERQLAPYHEFECTGEDDEFVQDMDVTEETRESWEEQKQRDGNTVRNFAEFASDWQGATIALGRSAIDLSGEHKYRYTLVEDGEVVEVVRRTNPNKKWDWYVVGGRWQGFFRVKAHSMAGALGVQGVPAMLDPSYEVPGPDRADVCFKADLDVEGMRAEAEGRAVEEWDLYQSVVCGLPKPSPWSEVLEKEGEEHQRAREEYQAQPAIKALRSNEKTIWLNPEDFDCSREEYLKAARDGALSTFAVIKDGEWHERGSMGWFGCVSDEKDKGSWLREFASLIDSLPDDALLTLVDCHI